ncbi:hypothetical protein N9948_01865 [bacterium]|nr:hypothetical protein [bacterium]
MRGGYNSLKRRAKQKGLSTSLSFLEYAHLKRQDCCYCGVSNLLLKYYCQVMRINTPFMSIDRADNRRGYTKENSVAACYLCNRTKSSFFNYEEMCKIGKMFVAPKLKIFEKQAEEAYREWRLEHEFHPDDWEGWEF